MYRNWPAISAELGEDSIFALTLSTIDLESDNGKRLIKAFPEFFSREEVKGPIPLSVIKERTCTDRFADGFTIEECELKWRTEGAREDLLEKEGIPVFLVNLGAFTESDMPYDFVEIVADEQPFQVIPYKGKQFFVLAICKGEYADVCPPECIAADL